MAISISRSPDDTEALGAAWGREARPGWVFALTGDLGAGKTQMVRGLARGLGSPARVHSPTFVLLTTYEGGRCPLHHIDLYRLSGPEEILQAGLDEYLYPRSAVAVVEWAEHWLGESTADVMRGLEHSRRVWIEMKSEEVREIRYEDFGA